MYEAQMGREMVMKALLASEQKKREDEKELQKLSEGKTTLKSVFKSKSKRETDIVTLKKNIEIAEADIQYFNKLIIFLTIYHGQIAIPKFKK